MGLDCRLTSGRLFDNKLCKLPVDDDDGMVVAGAVELAGEAGVAVGTSMAVNEEDKGVSRSGAILLNVMQLINNECM